MSKTPKSETSSRRDFLKLTATSAPAAVVAVAAGTSEAEAAEAGLQKEGMKDTAQTRAYYASARF